MSDYTDKEIADFVKAANSDLGSGKYSGDETIPDYCKAVNICQQLQATIAKQAEEIKRYRKVLEKIRRYASSFDIGANGLIQTKENIKIVAESSLGQDSSHRNR